MDSKGISMNFESLGYIKKRIAAGNDLSAKHGQILLDEIDRLREVCRLAGVGEYKANYTIGGLTETGKLREEIGELRHTLMELRHALEIIRDDETDYPGKVASEVLKGIPL